MSGQRRARIGLALALGAMLVTMIAAPASAAITTIRYVDDNPNATSCHGTKLHTIQAGIDASNASDIVYVCPGTYRESIVIDVPNLIVYSVKARRAHIVPPASSPGAAVVMEAAGAQLRRFSIDVPAGEADLNVRAGGNGPDCAPLFAAIVMLNSRQRVVSNRIDAIGTDTLSGDCGYLIGILAGIESIPVAGASGSASFLPLATNRQVLKRNYIRDFKLAGILVGGETSARILHNAVRFVHQDDPFTCVPVNTITADETAGLTYPCQTFAGQGVNPLNGIESFSIGIGAGLGAHVDIAYNTVYSTLDLDQEAPQIPLVVGIATLAADTGSRITENVVTQAVAGIAVDPISISLAGATAPTIVAGGPPPSNVDVTFNRTNEGEVGILVDGSGNYVYANRTRLNVFGLVSFEGENNNFYQNDSRYNFILDCQDETTGTGTAGTANTWNGNYGYDDYPDGICFDLSSDN